MICLACGSAVPATVYCINCGKELKESKPISVKSVKKVSVKQVRLIGGKGTGGAFGG
jgi:hypothetical protein